MAAGTLPDAPDIRPSVTMATLKPLSCCEAIIGVNLCSSGMPLAFGPCSLITAMKSVSSSPRANAACKPDCESNTLAGAVTT